MYSRKPTNPWLSNPLPSHVDMFLHIQHLKATMPNMGNELPIGIRKQTARHFRVVMTPEFHARFNKCKSMKHISQPESI